MKEIQRRLAGGMPLSMVRGFRGRVKPGAWPGSGENGLLFGELGLANVRQKSRVGGTATGVVGAGFFEAELAVDGEAHVGCVVVFLAVVLPPADRTKTEGCRDIESLVSAAGTTEAHFDRGSHTRMDGESGGRDY
jgi:hypothetical protein